jgi:hypothetical protein
MDEVIYETSTGNRLEVEMATYGENVIVRSDVVEGDRVKSIILTPDEMDALCAWWTSKKR